VSWCISNYPQAVQQCAHSIGVSLFAAGSI
jgi:hypothetical protein